MNSRVWERLVSGRPLDDLGLGVTNGRLDLRGLVAPQPSVDGPAVRFRNMDVLQLVGIMKLHRVTLSSLDFTGSRLAEILFTNCTIDDCVFDNCRCKNWALWGTSVARTSFRDADLRNAALGAVMGATRNSYRQVDFTGADLRGTAYTTAEFLGCTFKDTRLDKVDFDGSTFTDCTFEGELREVLFYRKGFRGEAFPPNEMERVDFSRAELRWSEFRGLDLANVRFPENEDHIVIDDYPQTLDQLLEFFSNRPDMGSKKLTAVLSLERKWVGARQLRGVLNSKDIIEMAGREGLDAIIRLVGNRRIKTA